MHAFLRRLGLALAALLMAPPLVLAFELEPPPRLPALAWMLADYATGNVLVEHNAKQRLPPASLTKLMTAYLLFERLRAGTLSLQDQVLVSAQASRTHGSRVPLRPGSVATVEDLLKSMLLRSANNATVALAEHVAGSEARFVDEMNARAQAWGLRETRFMNSTGLHAAGHVSSARDLTRIAAALVRDFPDYYRWFSLREFMFADMPVRNSNALLWRDEAVDGMKTGYTRHAGWCLVASARRDEMRLIATVLGARSHAARVNGGERLLEYGFRNFETRRVYAANEPAAQARVWLGEDAVVPLGVPTDVYLTLPRGTYDRLQRRVSVAEALYAPVAHGQRLGSLTFALDDNVFGQYPLVALKEVRNGGVVQRGIDNLQLWLY